MTIYEMQLGVKRLIDKVQSQSVAEFTDSEIDFFINRAYDKIVNELIEVFDETSTVSNLLRTVTKERELSLSYRESPTEVKFALPDDFFHPLTIMDKNIKYKPLKYLTFHSIHNDPFNKANPWESWYKIRENFLIIYSLPESSPEKINLLYVKSFEKLKKNINYNIESRKTTEYFPPEPLHYKIMQTAADLIKESLNLIKEPTEDKRK